MFLHLFWWGLDFRWRRWEDFRRRRRRELNADDLFGFSWWGGGARFGCKINPRGDDKNGGDEEFFPVASKQALIVIGLVILWRRGGGLEWSWGGGWAGGGSAKALR